MQEVNMDITAVTKGMVAHQCNCRGVMGAGVARAIREMWPKAYQDYMEEYRAGKLRLGRVVVSELGGGLVICHLCGQDDYGRDRRYTDYDALRECIMSMAAWRRVIWNEHRLNLPVYFPKGMGSRLAGGDWGVVLKIIQERFPDAIIVNYTQVPTKLLS